MSPAARWPTSGGFTSWTPQSSVGGKLRARYGDVEALVVRPDRYILGVAGDAGELDALIGRWTAHLRPAVAR